MTICGVYQICCEATGRVYVGSSRSIKSRWKAHELQLKRGKHYNTRLQRSWDKYGAECFSFVVLEYCLVGELITRESFWISSLESYTNGFNQTPTAEPLKDKTPEHIEKIRQIVIARNKAVPQTEEQRRASGDRLLVINRTLPQSAERREASRLRAKRMHAEGKLCAPVRTPEQRQNSSRVMKQLIAEGKIRGGFQSEAHREASVSRCRAGALNTPTQRRKASNSLKDWHAQRKSRS